MSVINAAVLFGAVQGTPGSEALPSTSEIVFLSMGIVFLGLILIIFAIGIMSAVVRAFSKKETAEKAIPDMPVVTTQKAASDNRANVQEQDIPHGVLVTVVSAAIAETMGTDVCGLRIHSIKRIQK